MKACLTNRTRCVLCSLLTSICFHSTMQFYLNLTNSSFVFSIVLIVKSKLTHLKRIILFIECILFDKTFIWEEIFGKYDTMSFNPSEEEYIGKLFDMVTIIKKNIFHLNISKFFENSHNLLITLTVKAGLNILRVLLRSKTLELFVI